MHNPQSNPVERSMREITRLFRTHCYSQHEAWVENVELNAYLYNRTINDGIGMTPYSLHTGLPTPKLIVSVFSNRDNHEDVQIDKDIKVEGA